MKGNGLWIIGKVEDLKFIAMAMNTKACLCKTSHKVKELTYGLM